MKLCSFSRDGAPRSGLLLGRETGLSARIFDLTSPDATNALGFSPACLEDIVESHLDAIRVLAGKPWPDSACVVLGSVRLMAPFHTRAKVIGVARNFHSAIAEQKGETPAMPFWFPKLPNTIIGPGEAVRISESLGNVTYEAEVGLVIGKRTKAVTEQDAPGHIAGYTLVNDVSGSAMIRADGGNFFRGKNIDTFCPMGPFFVTADEVPDPHMLRITMEVDGVRLQEGHTGDMVFNMYALVSALSQTMTLEPGDVIATGTPAGGAAMHSPPAWLRPGQTMRISVNGLGELENPVI